MTDQNNEDNRVKNDGVKMMHVYLEKFRQGKKFVLEKNIKEELSQQEKQIAQETVKRKIKKLKKKRIFKDIPDLNKLREFEPNLNIDHNNFLFDVGMVSILRKIIEQLEAQRYPDNIVQKCKDLFHLMLDFDIERVKKQLFEIAESSGVGDYHLLKAFIRIMFDTYLLED